VSQTGVELGKDRARIMSCRRQRGGTLPAERSPLVRCHPAAGISCSHSLQDPPRQMGKGSNVSS
jgi:hypothetical protein